MDSVLAEISVNGSHPDVQGDIDMADITPRAVQKQEKLKKDRKDKKDKKEKKEKKAKEDVNGGMKRKHKDVEAEGEKKKKKRRSAD